MAAKTKPTTVAEFIGGTRVIHQYIANLAKSADVPHPIRAALKVVASYFPKEGAHLVDGSGKSYVYSGNDLPAALRKTPRVVASKKAATKTAPKKATKAKSAPVRIADTTKGKKAISLIKTTKKSNVEIAKATGLDRRRVGELRKGVKPAAVKATSKNVAKKAAVKTAKVAPEKTATKAATPAKRKAKSPVHITATTRQRVIELFCKEKLTYAQIGAKVGIDRRRVGEIIRKS